MKDCWFDAERSNVLIFSTLYFPFVAVPSSLQIRVSFLAFQFREWRVSVRVNYAVYDLIWWTLNWDYRIDQFRYIKIQLKTIDLSTRLWGITTDFVAQNLVLKSIVLDWILINGNWSIRIRKGNYVDYSSSCNCYCSSVTVCVTEC